MRTLIAPALALVILLNVGCGKHSVEVAGLDAKQSAVIDKMVLKAVEKQWLDQAHDQARSSQWDFASMRSADDDTSYATGWSFPDSGFKIATAAKFHVHYRGGEDVTVTPTTESFIIELTGPLKVAETSLLAGTRLTRAKGGDWAVGDSMVQQEKPPTPHTEPLNTLPQKMPGGARANGVADTLAKWRAIIPILPDDFLVVYVEASRMLMAENRDASYTFKSCIKDVTVDLPPGITFQSVGSGVEVELESPPSPEVLRLMEEKLKHRTGAFLGEVAVPGWSGRGKKAGASAVHAGEVWRKASVKIKAKPTPTEDKDETRQRRSWTNASGKYTVDAEFVDFKDGKVRLRKADGKVLTIPIETLSKSDQAYVQQFLAQTGALVRDVRPLDFASEIAYAGVILPNEKADHETLKVLHLSMVIQAQLPSICLGDTRNKTADEEGVSFAEFQVLLEDGRIVTAQCIGAMSLQKATPPDGHVNLVHLGNGPHTWPLDIFFSVPANASQVRFTFGHSEPVIVPLEGLGLKKKQDLKPPQSGLLPHSDTGEEEPAVGRIPQEARPRGEGWRYSGGTVLERMEQEFGKKPYVKLEGGNVSFDVPGKQHVRTTDFHVTIGFVSAGIVPPDVEKAAKSLSEKLKPKGSVALLRADSTEFEVNAPPKLYADCVEYWFAAEGNQDDGNALVLTLPWGKLKLSRPR